MSTIIDIEKIKTDGAIRAIKSRIDAVSHEIGNRPTQNVKNNDRYIKFEAALNTAEDLLRDLRELFEELKRLEPGNG